MRQATFGVLVLSCLSACAGGAQEPVGAQAPPPKGAPVAPAHAEPAVVPPVKVEPAPVKVEPGPVKVEPTPDPITRPLDEGQARQEASRLAEAAFAARTDIVGADGKRVPREDFPAADFIGGLAGDRWKLRNEPPAGPWARVSFGKFGERPEVEVGFASE